MIFIYRFRLWPREGAITWDPHDTAISQIADFTSADGKNFQIASRYALDDSSSSLIL